MTPTYLHLNDVFQGRMTKATIVSSDHRIAFVQACWHKEIVDQCKAGFANTMQKCAIPSSAIDYFSVPGAFELPLFIKRLALTQRYIGFVASALVVDGGIYRHDFVADAVISGLMTVQLCTEIPVFSAVLTPHNFQSPEHVQFFHKHFFEKGEEVASACLTTLTALQRPEIVLI